MHLTDWIIMTAYLAGTVLVGVFLGRYVKSSSDMFAAGGKSPWWISGLSAFMTMFSANTFVVWGGIAYEHGMVAVGINLCYGVAAILAGYTVAGKWKSMGIATPAEYIDLRFGRAALHCYTWFMMAFRIVGTGGALYAIARLMLAVIGGEDSMAGAALASPQLNITILIFAVIVVGYTMIGGLWAVLMTDTLQFIILNLAVIFVIPLSLARTGGFSGFMEKAPEGFLAATSDQYTFLFLVGWVAIHYFMIGAEWAFVQRYLCVPSKKDARKSAFLFGGLYLFSPFLWLLPPLLWRVQQPIPDGTDADTVTRMSETAYILSCKAVLPIGMLGLMLAALFSATASMISSQLNVFSGVLTKNIYEPLAKNPGEKQLVRMGRLFTCILGFVIAGIAIAVPYIGGAAKMIISVTQVMVTPLLAPALLALFFRRLGTNTIWATVGICFPLGLLATFTEALDGTWIANKTFTGVILPLLVIAVMLLISKREALGWRTITELTAQEADRETTQSSALPARIVGISLAVCAATLFCLIPLNDNNQGMLAGFGLALALLSSLMLHLSRRMRQTT
ncbi:MAG TPA: Na+:solute symporter [Verrucomicrobiales bacterium]|nr:Na+:solute symporter [Verrucomicrobiales bacterium]HCL96246.1 Na+:solute symporter [Verrucomicrobiales bacterium]